MDYRALLAAPLAAVAVSSSANELRMPADWTAGHSFIFPPTASYVAGVDPQAEEAGQRALTVKATGWPTTKQVGSVQQSLVGYAGKRVRLSGQAMAAGTAPDGWAGLVMGAGTLPLWLRPGADDRWSGPTAAARACPTWCDVSVVMDIPADSDGFVNVGAALVGPGQVWVRRLAVQVVGPDVPPSATPFVPELDRTLRASIAESMKATASHRMPPRNLALD